MSSGDPQGCRDTGYPSGGPDGVADGAGGAGVPGEPGARAAVPGWASGLDRDTFSVTETVGGWRGVVESVAPGLVFVVLYVTTRDLAWTLAASAGLSVVFCVARLVRGQALTQAVSGLLGVGIGVVWALLSGRGENYFAWGMVTAGAFALALLASQVLRHAAVGEVAALVWGLPAGWRTDPALSRFRRRSRGLTWVWTAMFLVRLGVQWPLWRAGEIAALGVAKLVLGLPLFALVCWVTWVGLRPFAHLQDGAATARGAGDGRPAGEGPEAGSGTDGDTGGAQH